MDTTVDDLFRLAAECINAQEVPDEGRWIVTPPGLVPHLRHLLLIQRNRAMAAARRKRHTQRRCGYRKG